MIRPLLMLVVALVLIVSCGSEAPSTDMESAGACTQGVIQEYRSLFATYGAAWSKDRLLQVRADAEKYKQKVDSVQCAKKEIDSNTGKEKETSYLLSSVVDRLIKRIDEDVKLREARGDAPLSEFEGDFPLFSLPEENKGRGRL